MANYNAFSIDTCPSYTSENEVCDEKSYINNFAPELKSNGFDAHFIVDTGKFSRGCLSYAADVPNLYQVATVTSPLDSWSGVTGAMLSTLASVLVPPPTPVMNWLMPLSG